MEGSDLKRVKELLAENTSRKRLYAEPALENTAMDDLIAKNCRVGKETRRRAVSDGGTRSPGDSIMPLCGTVAVGFRPGS
jgi:hypothetical protein